MNSNCIFLFFVFHLVQAQLVINPKYAESAASHSMPLDLSGIYNNRAFAMRPNDSNFDGFGSGYPAQFLPPVNFIYTGVNYTFPQYDPTGNDNVLAQGQTIQIPKGRYFSIQMLSSSDTNLLSGSVNATYSDSTTSSSPVLVPAWFNWGAPAGGDIIFPYYFSNTSVNWNRSMLYQTVHRLDSSKELVSLTLPNITHVHIFALSAIPAIEGIGIEVQYARSTQMWIEGSNKTQIVEVAVNNIGSEWILANNSVQVEISSPGYTTVAPGIIRRLQPGDQVKVQIGVENAVGIEPGTIGEATAMISGVGVSASYSFNATFGIVEYEATYESIYSHESPNWYQGAKYGIFIHWGVYSVPGWGNVGKNETYAEWFWWDQNLGPSTPEETYQYSLATYGPDHVYDDFIQNFTADAFNPKDWVDLFSEAGAKYFVQVSKHHDGFSLYDLPSNVSQRTSVALPPHRNLLQELFDAASTYQPSLRRGTYHSGPEWFNPAWAKYGFSQWPGGNATNPYTNVTLPYTGFVAVEDYLQDALLPELNSLADMGTEFLWFDIGGPNVTAEFASKWFNDAAAEGRQVLINNRGGLPGDLDTPEYAQYDSIQVRKWESSRGMDPFSYGYNRATPDNDYMNATTIVRTLLDIVSKNGNFLLDIGPQANGTIIDVQQNNLREAGKWINSHAEAIFNTTYWFVTPEEGNVRFTQTADAFYIISMEDPGDQLQLQSPVPWVEGDNVSVVGGNMSGAVVTSMKQDDGSLLLNIGDDIRKSDDFAWIFKIDFSDGKDNGSAASNSNVSAASSTASQPLSRGWSGMMLLECIVTVLFTIYL